LSRRLVNGRYRLLERLGAGGRGVVFRARDEATGDQVALKALAPGASGDLRGEFACLAALDHPGIVRVLDYGATEDIEEGREFFTMELAAGQPITEALGGAEDPSLFPAAASLCQALQYLHSRGLVHGDVKPANVLVEARRRDELVLKLLDFGFTAAQGTPELAGRGTAAYMAPEVIRGDAVDHRADLYSLGVLLFEVAAGRPLFESEDPLAVLRATLFQAPPDLRLLCPGLPLGLEEVISGLLQKEPGARYSSADEALAALNEVSGREDQVSVPEVDYAYVLTPPLVGREQVLDSLLERAGWVTEGRGGSVLLEGDAGVGRSRLIQELSVKLRLAGVPVFRAAFGEPGERPLGAAAAALSELAMAYQERASRVVEAHAEVVDRLKEAAPGPVETGAAGDDRDATFRAFEAIAALLDDLAVAQPFALVLEDLHEASSDVLAMARYIAFRRHRGPYLLLLSRCTGVRPRAGEEAEILFSDLEVSDSEGVLRLGRLELADVEALVRGTLGDAPGLDTLAGRLHRDSGGVVGEVVAMLGALVGAGALTRRRGQWHLETDRLPRPDEPLPGAGEDRDRLELLLDGADETQGRVLEMAAALGFRGSLAALRELCERFAPRLLSQLLTALEGLGRVGLLVTADSGEWQLGRPGLREAVLGRLTRAKRTRLGKAAAAVLEGRQAPAATVAARWGEAGERRRAAEAGLAASEAALSAGARAEALELLQRVLDWLPARDRRREKVHVRIASLALTLGRFEVAEEAAEPLLARGDRPDLLRTMGDVARERGAYPRALECYEQGLEAARAADDDSLAASLLYAAGWVRMMQGDYPGAREAAAESLQRARQAEDPEGEARAHILFGNVGWYTAEFEDARSAFAEAERRFNRLGDRKGRGDALTGTATVARLTGKLAEAADLYQQALTLYRQVGAATAVAKGFNNLGVAKYLLGEWTEATDLWEVYAQTCRQIDERAERVNALNNLGFLYKDRGDLTRAEKSLRAGLTLADAVGYRRMRSTLLGNLGEVLALRGEREAAAETYDEAEAEARAIGASAELVELDRRRGELLAGSGGLAAARELLLEALEGARELSVRGEEAAALVVLAALDRRTGDAEQALLRLDEAEVMLEELGSQYELARARIERARCLADSGRGSEAREQLGQARAVLEPLGARADLAAARSLEDRLAVSGVDLSRQLEHHRILLEVARGIAPILDLESLLTKVVDKTIEVAGADRGFLILVEGEGRSRFRVGRDRQGHNLTVADFTVSRSVVDRVLATGEPVAVADVEDAEGLKRQASVVNLGLRAIACVPLVGREADPVGLVYVDARKPAATIAGLDLPLLEALAAHAAVAIENARLYEEQVRRRELVATVAHELKTPLTAISGFADLLRMDRAQLSQEQAEYLDQIGEQTDRMTRLVHNVLDLSLVEAGVAAWSRVKVDLREVFADAVAALEPIAAVSKVSFQLALPGRLPPVLGDPDRLSQVATNLLSNAVRFSPEEETVVIAGRAGETSARLRDGSKTWPPARGQTERRWVEVMVADKGPGVPEEDRERIFERFQRDGKRGGHGLGLPITRAVVEEHGGRIWVEGGDGLGAVFVVSLPEAAPE